MALGLTGTVAGGLMTGLPGEGVAGPVASGVVEQAVAEAGAGETTKMGKVVAPGAT